MGNAINSINQKESVDAIQASLQADGHEITKADIDRVLDKARDLSIATLVAGKSIKVRGLGSLTVREHQARDYKLPDGTVGTAPAGFHVQFVESDSLLEAMNTTPSI